MTESKNLKQENEQLRAQLEELNKIVDLERKIERLRKENEVLRKQVLSLTQRKNVFIFLTCFLGTLMVLVLLQN